MYSLFAFLEYVNKSEDGILWEWDVSEMIPTLVDLVMDEKPWTPWKFYGRSRDRDIVWFTIWLFNIAMENHHFQ